MSGELNELPEYSETMARLEAAKHTRSDGLEYWRAREMQRILGYVNWRDFGSVLVRKGARCAEQERNRALTPFWANAQNGDTRK